MDMPEFNEEGLLPLGVYEADIDTIRNRFCTFGNLKKRNKLFETFLKYLQLIKKHETTYEVYIDGSFVTSKDEPDDIDILLFYDFEYFNQDWLCLIHDDYIRIKFKGLQVLTAFLESDSSELTLEFSQLTSYVSNNGKGVVKVIL